MKIIPTIFKIFISALFPTSKAEQEILSMLPEKAFEILPKAPGYEGLAVPLNNSRSIFAYKDERVSKLIWNIKYKKSEQAIKIGSYALWHELCLSRLSILRCDLNPSDPKVAPEDAVMIKPSYRIVIIPIPITSRRRKERGYNQCELLVDEIERLDTAKHFIIEKNLLIRTHHTNRQTLKGRMDRLESAKGIFALDENLIKRSAYENIFEYPVIIIDDVITTGSTMYEAIEAIRKAGFHDIRGLSLAH